MTDWLVKLEGKDGSAVLSKSTGKWEAGDDRPKSVKLANSLQSKFQIYRKERYSPGEGYPGYSWARKIAKHNNLKYEDHPCPSLPKDAIA